MSNAREIKEVRLTPGSHQAGRMPYLLWPEHIKIDERSLEDLLAYLVKYADYLRFINERGEHVEGWWKNFLLKDISVFLADIASTDPSIYSQKLDKLIRNFEEEKDDQWGKIAGLIGFAEEIFMLLDGWYTWCLKMSLKPSEWNPLIVEEFEKMIKAKLKYTRLKLIEYNAFVEGKIPNHKNKDEQAHTQKEKFGHTTNNIWLAKKKNSFSLRGIDDANVIFKQVQLIYRDFYDGLGYIINTAKRLFPLSLEKKQDHSPDIGLLIAFLKLYKHSQNHLNQLTERHLNHFYVDILKQKPKGGIPDKVSIYAELAKHVQYYKIKEGTLLSAGRNEKGIEIHYQADEYIWLQQAHLVDIKTLRLTKNNIAGLQSPLVLVSNIFEAPVANASNGLEKDEKSHRREWPLFGEPQEDKTIAEKNMVDSEIGFAISDPTLFLKEGTRKVEITLRFDLDSYSRRLVNDNIAAAKLLDLIESILAFEKQEQGAEIYLDKEKVFNKVFQDCLNIKISTEKGWLDLNYYRILPPKDGLGKIDWKTPEITISFQLNSEHPAITAPVPELILEDWDTQYPVIHATLNPSAPAYVYSFFKYLKLETVSINVEVEGVKDLDFYTDIGKLDAATPFQVFGPIPKVGSYLLIGNTEIFKKALSDISINIEWYNLPESFTKYYAAYGKDIDNQSFEVEISARSNYQFYPSQSKQKLTLFQEKITDLGLESNGQAPALKPFTNWRNLDLERLGIVPIPTLDRTLAFDANTISGFFKLELSAPNLAFGHQIYPSLFLETVTENAQANQGRILPQRSKKNLPLPDQPYTPVAKAITIDYQAAKKIHILPSTSADISNEASIYHIYPFGKKKIFGSGKIGERSLLPQYHEEGYLYLGFDKLETAYPISLLFRITKSSLADHTVAKWSYLTNDIWISVPSENLLFDGTENFTRTGIIKLHIPEDISSQHQIMPSNLYWLRLEASGMMVNAIDIHPNAFTATWVENEKLSKRNRVLSPHSINNLAVKVPEVRKIVQPYYSYGGRNPENIRELYARISERLRHKNRGISTWDIERLILERFHDLHQVKCLSYEDIDHFQKKIDLDRPMLYPGGIIIIVVPKMYDSSNLQPSVNLNYLKNIEKFISNYVSPFVVVKAWNPVYEVVKINCEVFFNEGVGKGEAYEIFNRDIQKFMCPWSFDSKTPLDIGGRLNKDALLNYIQRRPYVRFVNSFSIVQVIKAEKEKFKHQSGEYRLEDTTRAFDDSPVIQASTPWSVLIPLYKHKVDFAKHENFDDTELLGGESLMIGVDYVIGEGDNESDEKTIITRPKSRLDDQQMLDEKYSLEIEDIDFNFEE